MIAQRELEKYQRKLKKRFEGPTKMGRERKSDIRFFILARKRQKKGEARKRRKILYFTLLSPFLFGPDTLADLSTFRSKVRKRSLFFRPFSVASRRVEGRTLGNTLDVSTRTVPISANADISFKVHVIYDHDTYIV